MGSARHLIGRGVPLSSTTLHYPAIHLTARLNTTIIFPRPTARHGTPLHAALQHDTTSILQHGTTRYSTAQRPTARHYVPHHNTAQQTFSVTALNAALQHAAIRHNINSQPNGTNTKPNI